MPVVMSAIARGFVLVGYILTTALSAELWTILFGIEKVLPYHHFFLL